MIKKFFEDSIRYGLSKILSRGISILLLPIYTRLFSPTDYGAIDLMVVFAFLVNVTIALEISQGAMRLYPEAKTRSEKIVYASSALWFTVSAYLIFMIIALV